MPFCKWLSTICIFLGICLAGTTDFAIAYCQDVDAVDSRTSTFSTTLRISWGGGSAKKWVGNIRIEYGRFVSSAILGIGPDSPASILVDEQEIQVLQSTKSTYEGIDVEVQGNSNTRITFELKDQGASVAKSETYSLSQIIAENQVDVLDSTNNRFSIVRLPSDRVQFKTDRPHLIFNTDERFQFDIRVNEIPDTPFVGDCLVEIAPARTNGIRLYSNTISVDQRQDPSRFLNYELKVPSKEGVYNLRFQLNPNLGQSRYRRQKYEREIQFVVLDSDKVALKSDEMTKLVAEIRPQSLRSSLSQQQIGHLSRLIGLKTNQAVGRFQINDEQIAVQLPVGGWQAVPIDIQKTGEPHLVEIEYDSSESMSLGFSILQPDQSGQIPNLGFDSGVFVPDSVIKVNPKEGKQVHRFSFWPNTRKVHLLIANRDSSRTAVYRRIRVFQADKFQPLQKSSNRHEKRSMMAFFEQPTFIENFGVNNFEDPELRQPIHDWISFYDSINRLAQHLVDSGCTGAFINVYGEGSSLIPLASQQLSPRFDSGVFSTAGHDPIRKDVVELIYRIFEKHDLKFVPTLNFDHRFNVIEFNNDLVKKSARLTDFRGQHVTGENYPLYNPLSSIVQMQILQTVQEIANRYRKNDFYSGLAVVCRPDSMTLLPGSRIGGYGIDNIKKFDPTLSDDKVSQQLMSQLLSREYIDKWLRWRAQSMTAFYQEMKTAVCKSVPQANLYLAPIDIFKNEELQSLLSPSLHRSTDVADAIMKLGLDLKKLHQDENLIVLQPEELAPIHSLASKRSEIVAQSTMNRDHWYRENRYPANLFLHRSSWARFENLENASVFSKQQSPILRLQHLNPAGVWNHERFVQAVLESDSRELIDGGMLVNTNMDAELLRLRKIYSSLPNKRFVNVSHQTHPKVRHPVATRYLEIQGQTYLYCVNGSPWPVKVRINSGGRQNNGQWYDLGDGQKTLFSSDRPNVIDIELDPFELFAIKSNATGYRFENFDYQLPESASRDLNKTYYELRSHVIASGNAKPVRLIDQPSFENATFSNGWNVGSQDSSLFTFDNIGAFHGRHSLKLDNQQDVSVWVRSQKFAAPVTGRLSVSVWLKTGDVDKQPPLRISIEGADKGSSYYRFAEVGSLVQDKRRNQVSNQWKRFVVHFEDLPIFNTAEFRIGFDLMGPGTVWIDHVELYDRWMDEIDMKALTQLFAGVGPLTSRPESLEQCRKILNGFWPQFLREFYSEEKVGEASVVTEQPLRSTMRRRFRRFVSPGIFQFR